MKFFKGMLGRPADVLDRYGPTAAMEDLRATPDEPLEEYGPFEEDETDALANDEVDVPEPEMHDTPEPEVQPDVEPPTPSNEAAAGQSRPDSGRPDPGRADASRPNRSRPESSRPNPTQAESGRADHGKPPSSRPESMKIWELFDEEAEAEVAEEPTAKDAAPPMNTMSPERAREVSERSMAREALAMIQARSPGALRDLDPAGTPAGRAKTRLIGFAGHDAGPSDIFKETNRPTDGGPNMFPVGWLIIIEGPGRGASFTLFSGLTQIGRGEEQTISLNFGDHSISRENHASIAYDDEDNLFYLGHGGKANIVRLNGRPVLSTEDLSNGDLIRIGETTLRFVALCGTDFAWDLTEDEDG
ncbi:MAG: FHA domain-containing protein [Pseudomonadota bacterium]